MRGARPAADHRRLRRHPGRRRHAHRRHHRRLGRAGAGRAASARAGKIRQATKDPIKLAVAAISAGIIEGEARLDLPYVEDSAAEVDCNFVMTDTGGFVEIQGTAEKDSFIAEDYGQLVALATGAMKTLFGAQQRGARRAREP